MKFLIPVSLLLVLISGCGSSWNNIPTVTMTAPLNDNAALSCAATEILLPVSTSAPRVLHLRLTQGAFVWEDSLSTYAGTTVTFIPPALPLSTAVTLTGWASDSGGAGCPTTAIKTPTVVYKAPARPTIQ